MSDVLIKGMEMPKGLYLLVLIINSDGSVEEIVDSEEINETDSKAVEVPPHGRLIDADKGLEFYADVLIKNFPATQKATIDEMILGMKKMLDALPTVLEAST